MEVSGQLQATAALLPRKRAPNTHWRGGWVGPRAGLDAVDKRKNLALPGIESEPSSPPLYRLRAVP
jgi:hypothetical protein